jgi:hypothetical protein
VLRGRNQGGRCRSRPRTSRAQRLAISIQRQRWYGWQTLDTEYTAYTSSYWVSDVMWYDCYNSGTWTYRVIVTGYAAGGRYGKTVQSANYLRTTC